MIKTASEIESDIYKLVMASPLKNAITGEICPDGTRLLDSYDEDAVIGFLAGIGNQVQEGVVNINIYVTDIDGGGTKVKNGARCNELEKVIRDVVENLPTEEYDFSLGQTIKTFKAEGVGQHYVNARLQFRRITH